MITNAQRCDYVTLLFIQGFCQEYLRGGSRRSAGGGGGVGKGYSSRNIENNYFFLASKGGHPSPPLYCWEGGPDPPERPSAETLLFIGL